MAASFRFTGPACCCCKHTIRGDEINGFMMPAGGIGTTLLYETLTPADARNNIRSLTSPGGDSFSSHMIGPDWANKRIFYAYNTWARTMGSVTDTDATFRYWDTKTSSSTGVAITTVNSRVCDSLAADPDNEHIYWASHDYHAGASPSADVGIDYSIELRRMDYDGTNQTTLDTVPVNRATSATRPAVIGPMLVNRDAARLYYVVRQNYTTASNTTWEWEIRYRDFATFTETSIYSVTGAHAVSAAGDTVIQLLNCLSFDLADGKIYWCEHYMSASNRQEGKVRRANLDGSGVELLYQSADPYAVNFARYSNSLGKIVHGDKDRTANVFTPKDGIWLRDKAAWATAEQIAKEGLPETSNFDLTSSFLWCGYEGTQA